MPIAALAKVSGATNTIMVNSTLGLPKPNQNNAITTQIIGGMANKIVITGLSNAIAVLKLPAINPAAKPATKAMVIPTTERHNEIPISFCWKCSNKSRAF